MPIEIKELHIRIAVNAQDAGSSSVSAGAPAVVPGHDVDAVVALCVEHVMQLLRDRTER